MEFYIELLRILKEGSELELWKIEDDDKYTLDISWLFPEEACPASMSFNLEELEKFANDILLVVKQERE